MYVNFFTLFGVISERAANVCFFVILENFWPLWSQSKKINAELIRSNYESTNPVFTNICYDFFFKLLKAEKKMPYWSKVDQQQICFHFQLLILRNIGVQNWWKQNTLIHSLIWWAYQNKENHEKFRIQDWLLICNEQDD